MRRARSAASPGAVGDITTVALGAAPVAEGTSPLGAYRDATPKPSRVVAQAAGPGNEGVRSARARPVGGQQRLREARLLCSAARWALWWGRRAGNARPACQPVARALTCAISAANMPSGSAPTAGEQGRRRVREAARGCGAPVRCPLGGSDADRPVPVCASPLPPAAGVAPDGVTRGCPRSVVDQLRRAGIEGAFRRAPPSTALSSHLVRERFHSSCASPMATRRSCMLCWTSITDTSARPRACRTPSMSPDSK